MMNFRQIEAFKAVIETGTVSRAAKQLYVSQPAVSKLLQNLEYAMGLELFERRPGRLLPTADALLLYDEVTRVYKGMERLESFVTDMRQLHGVSLNIGVMPALSTGFIQDLMFDFHRRYSATKLSLHARSTLKVVDMLRGGGMDIGISAHPVSHPEIERLPLCELTYACILPRGHRLAERSAIRPEDLEGEPFLSFTEGSDKRSEIDRIFSEARVSRNIVVEASMAPSICAMVARGFGVAILSPLYLGAFEELVTVRPFTSELREQVSMLLPRYRPRSRQLNAFMGSALEYCSRLSAREMSAAADSGLSAA